MRKHRLFVFAVVIDSAKKVQASSKVAPSGDLPTPDTASWRVSTKRSMLMETVFDRFVDVRRIQLNRALARRSGTM